MKTFDADRWNTAEVKSGKSFVFDLEYLVSEVSVAVRCPEKVVLSAVTQHGETFFLASGQVIDFVARLQGFVALHVSSADSAVFAYRVVASGISKKEKRDPTPLAVSQVIDDQDMVSALIKRQVLKYVQSLKKQGIIPPDVDDGDLEEDILKGDYDWDDEAEDFGPGFVDEDENAPFLPFPERIENAPGDQPGTVTEPAEPAKSGERSEPPLSTST